MAFACHVNTLARLPGMSNPRVS
ncbi:hypothetical protein CCACVL1_12427 [Corchorus capsularis]|uniref:Uncharacterized protein n=1 Tax=Corchorus capsularis TaxID=210143 RepID=A0A1R3IFQ7_COCAP|nr:hypothetical protein CCACVL1_12427 [Corchorus capsularis]